MRNTRQCHILFIDNRNQAPTGSWALRAAGPEPSSGARPRHPVHRQISSSSSSSSSSRAKGGSGLHRFDPVTHRRHFPPPPPPPVAVQPRHLARATAKRKERERERERATGGNRWRCISSGFRLFHARQAPSATENIVCDHFTAFEAKQWPCCYFL